MNYTTIIVKSNYHSHPQGIKTPMNPETERVHAGFPFTVTFCFSDHIYSHLPSSRYITPCGLRLLLLESTNS